jgi:hypothetical protein
VRDRLRAPQEVNRPQVYRRRSSRPAPWGFFFVALYRCEISNVRDSLTYFLAIAGP